MNVIDLEILIPASPEFIWRFLGDPGCPAAQWQGRCNVTCLISFHAARGARHALARIVRQVNSDVVVEVSAWYDTLGYEYRRNGRNASFAENQGRVSACMRCLMAPWFAGLFNTNLARRMLGGLRNAMRYQARHNQSDSSPACVTCTSSFCKNQAASPPTKLKPAYKKRLMWTERLELSNRAIHRPSMTRR